MVKTQANDVHSLTGKGDRDLSACEVLHALCFSGGKRACLTTDFIVVGQRPEFDAVGFGAGG